MSKIEVRIFSHHFSIKCPIECEKHRRLLETFSTWFDEYELQEVGGQWSKQYARSYASPEADNEYISWDDPNLEQRFHINGLPHLQKLFEHAGAAANDIVYIREPIYGSVDVEIDIKPHFKPFEEQVPILDQLMDPNPVSKLLGLQTGGGKSALAVFAAKHWGKMTVCLMKPGYIDKWVDDIAKQCNIADEKIVCASGSAELIHVITGLNAGWLTPSFVLISNATFRNWIAEQEKLPPGELVPGFPIEPWEFMQYCGFGFRIIDEAHQDFHANFKFDLYTHVEQSLSLSATLLSRNEYLMKMYKMAYPEANRMKVPEYRKYIRSIAWMYDFFDPRKIRTTERGRSTYSHTAFEKSILQNTKLLKHYLLMVYESMRKTYFFERKQGEKCILYFATRKMCEKAMFYFKQKMPDIKFAKFNQGDKLEQAKAADIIIATLMKGGTAIDIPNLTTVVLTIAVDSIQSVLQCMGRLRDIAKLYGSDKTPTFVYFTCKNLDKHMRYHKSKKELLKEKAAIMTEIHHNVSLGY